MKIKEEVIEILKKTNVALTTQQISLELCSKHNMESSDSSIFATEVSHFANNAILSDIFIVDPKIKGKRGGRAYLIHPSYLSTDSKTILLEINKKTDERIMANYDF